MLIEKFEETVDAFSQRIAIKMEAETFTYWQLNQYANQVAAQIIASAGLSNKGKQAALLFEHGVDMIIGLIAALKANMVYVPLDRTYPENRLAYMLENSGTTLILTNTNNLPLAQRLARKIKGKIDIMDIREINTRGLERNVNRTVSGEAPAYILYTSGSTGRPKGVVQNHDNVLYYTRNWIERFSITPGDRMTLLTAFSHDGFVQDLWSALLSGATIYPYDVKNVLEHTRLSEFIKNEKITIWHSVPTLFRYFTDSLTPGERFLHVRFILLGGEPLRKHDIDIFKTFFPNAALANVYGQTESSVSSIALYTREDKFGLPILGEPLDKTEILLVTEEGEILEDMGTGEIVIACSHLAPGYWQDDESTREKFTHDPDLGKLYWTGDLGRLKGNKEITIIGRKDLQIKIRGFRVEVGEIETVLLKYEAVKEAAVILKETQENEPYLCCYFTSKKPVNPAQLREYLFHQVPDYMIPRTFIQLELLPLTPSGKIDRNALPDPGTEEMEKEFKPPNTGVQRQLAEIWQEVLNLKPKNQSIGIDDNFFELGGHSLRAIRLIARVHKTFQVKLELEEVFSFPILRELAHLIDSKGQENFKAIHLVEKKQFYPLSSTQKRLYFLQQMEPGGTGYNLSDIMELEEEIDIKKVEETFQKLVQRHESLRTSFHMIDDQLVQMVHEQFEFDIEYYDLEVTGAGDRCSWGSDGTGGLAPLPIELAARSPQTAAALISSFVRPFDLSKASLLRVGLIKLPHTPAALCVHPSQEGKDHKYILMMDMHHIISDGTSQEIFSEDFKRLYEDRGLLSLKLQYKDYAQWQRGEIDRDVLKQQESYWLNEFSSDIPVLELPTDYPRPLIQGFEGDIIRFALEKQASQGLKQLAQQEEVTLYMVLLAVVNVLLFKLSGQEDIVIGTPVVGRRHADLEGIIGMFVNTLTLRNYPQGEKTFAGFLKEIKEKTMKAFENQEYPFEELVDRAAVHRDMSRNPLFDVMFALHNQSTLPPEMLKVMKKGRYDNIPFRHNRSNFDLTFNAIEAGELLGFSVEYSTKLFKKETIQRFIRYLQVIVSSVSKAPSRKLSDINVLSKEEIEQLLIEFNRTDAQYPRHQTIYQLFKAQVEKTPDHIAVVGTHHLHESTPLEGTRGLAPLNALVTITYRELSQRSDQLAYLLGKKGIVPDTIVGIMADRSIEMIIGILSILKAGGAYMPIDAEYPEERIQYMLKDVKVKIIVKKSNEISNFAAGEDIDVIFIDDAINKINKNYPEGTSSHLHLSPAPVTSLAYILYTSGTTGRPKGVMVEHRNATAYLDAFNREFGLTGKDSVVQQASFTFDVFFEEVFPVLLTSGKVVIPFRDQVRDINLMEEFIIKHSVTIISCTPLMLNLLNQGNKLDSVRIFISGGDVLKSEYIGNLLKWAKVYNTYGPTETTVCATYYHCSHPIKSNVPLGKPIANYNVYILDNHHLVPISVPGEICITGPGVARGYLNNPELTNYKFLIINDKLKTEGAPFGQILDASHCPITPLLQYPIYLTGDLARWLPDGNIEFLGRIDSQIKIRGFRIEPGEIENQLLNYKDVTGAVVILQEDETGDKYLCAYIVSDKEIVINQLKEYLSHSLPYYMIPSHVVQVEKVPLTVHGKVDNKALPKPVIPKPVVHLAPRNWWEEKMTLLWCDVLGIAQETLSMDANFFDIGGHSLKATILVSKIHKTFNVKLPLVEVFKQPSIREQALYIKNNGKDKYVPITPVEKKEYYDLSSAQKRLYILQQLEPGSTSYNMPQAISLADETDIKELERAFIKLIKRHESLRTSFFQVDEKPVQKVHDEVEFSIEYFDLQAKGEGDRCRWKNKGTSGLAPLFLEASASSDQLAASTIRNFVRPFELALAPLLQVGLIELPHTPAALRAHPSQEGKEHKYILMIDMHHIITDGISQDILKKEFMALYQEEELLPLAPMRLGYKDFSGWQNREKQRQLLKQQEFYWIKAFPDELPVLNLPTDYPRPVMQSFEGSSVNFVLNEKETRILKNIAQENNATLFMVVLSVFTILLSKLSGQEDILVGTAIAGRRHADLENIIGMFVNTLVIRSRTFGEKTFTTFLNEVKINTLEAFENQDYQFEDLVEKVVVKRDTSRNPLFDVMFAMQHRDSSIQESLAPKEKPIPWHFEARVSKFDLTLQCTDAGKTIFFIIEYATRLFKPETIRRFIVYFKQIVSAILTNPDHQLTEIRILTREEIHRILYVFNDTAVDFQADKTIHQLFEEQVERTSDQIALLGPKLQITNYNSVSVTYKELNQKSNQMAHLLRKKGVGFDTVVAIMLERSIEMIIGILGILKAGGVYMPIEPDYPPDRINYMLKDSSAKILLTGQEMAGFYSHLHLPLAPATALAYVIYTSGSTGWPKGVLIQHRNIVNTLTWRRQEYRMGTLDVSLQLLSYCFDAFVTSFFTPIISGARVILLTKEEGKDITKIRDAIHAYNVTQLTGVPMLFEALMDAITAEEALFLKAVTLGGDKVHLRLVEAIKGKNPEIEIFNEYGVTEASVVSTFYRFQAREDRISIGKPISNTVVVILNKTNHLQPIGVPGELCISGIGLARGYLNKPELTNYKFLIINDQLKMEGAPFGQILKACGEKKKKRTDKRIHMSHMSYLSHIYKSGDLARWLPDGTIEFIGRTDHQVKIRGFRIETGEIENQLLKHKAVKEAVVICREDQPGEKYLCAYIVGNNGLTGAVLRGYLMGKVPNYMIPAAFVQLETMPLTPHGKVNRKRLQTTNIEKTDASDYIRPENEIEKKLVDIWSEVLVLDKKIISTGVNFFEIGGHSLKATILIAKIHKTLKVKVPLGEIFKSPTIRGLAGYIRKTEPNQGYTTIEPAESREFYPLSPTQRGIYILQRMAPTSTAYHIPFFMTIKGIVDKQRFEGTFRALIKHHGSLRTSFDLVNGEPVQKIHDTVEFEIEYHSAKHNAQSSERGGGHHAPCAVHCASTIKNFIRPFDLAFSPLFRVGMIRSEEKIHILMMDIHHIVSDGTSINILVKDFMALYQGKELPPPGIQYKDYSQWQNSRPQREEIAKQEMIWLREFDGQLPLLNLPLDFPRPPVQEFTGNSLPFELSPQQTRTVKNFVLREKISTYMMILAVFTLLMAKLSGQEDIIVGSPTAGRNHENLQSIVGMFVNTLALRNFPVYYKTFKEYIHEVKDKTLTAFESQDYPFEKLVEQLGSGIPRDLGRNPLFDVMVAPQDIEVTTVQIPGLKLEPYTSKKNGIKTAKFDLSLLYIENQDQLIFSLSYRTRLFKKETIQRFINYYKKIFTTVMGNPQKRINEIEIITENEKQQILKEFNDNAAGYPREKTVPKLFEEQVERTPDRIALVGVHETHKKHEEKYNMSYLSYMSYKELNKKSNQLAHLLRTKGVEPDTIVGIMVMPSIEMIIALSGILKAGGAYMPIEPHYPQDRIEYMLTDSRVNVLVTIDSLFEDRKNLEILFLDFSTLLTSHLPPALAPTVSFSTSTLTSTCQVSPANLAYVIYTSGTTGKPKGVMIENQNVVRLVKNSNFIHFTGNDKLLLTGSIVFDITTFEIWGPLLNGIVLFLVEQEIILDGEKLAEIITKNRISIFHLIPQLFNQLANQHPGIFAGINYLLVGGDIVRPHYINYIRNMYKTIRVLHMYGPTENTTFSTFFPVNKDYEMTIPIGKPIGNSSIYIIDKHNKLTPPGVVGELCVGGGGVARGYLNNPAQTMEKFVENPLVPGEKFYMTGDMGKWLSDGNIEFLGRNDQQVKVLGIRVELGEIENQLRRIKGVQDVVVIAREGQPDEKYLCAYIAAGGNIDISYIRDELGKRLPGYMIPAFFVPLEEFPLTPNRKVDRNALPEPETQFKKNNCHNPPRNHIEERLADIWVNVLFEGDVKQVSIGIDDNFFELGGNSLKVIRLISEINKTFNIEVPMGLIFKNPSIRSISAHLMQQTFTAAKDEVVLLLGPGKTGSENIFCFPPAIGYGIAYMGLITFLSSYSLYGFNYIEDEDKDRDKMERYLDTIIEIQPQGPYTLLGYSAGGRLCLKAAELLEKKGNQVMDIILLDYYSQRKSLPDDVAEERSREFNHQLKQGLKELGLEPMTEKVMDTMEKYAQYHDTLQELEPAVLNANIHLIKAEDKQGQEGFIGWKAFTRSEYHEYEGFGIHKEMLSAGFIEQNAAVINNILTPVPQDKKFLHHTLSGYQLKFLEFVRQNPEAFIGSNYQEMIEKLNGNVLQPWPTFIDQPARKIMEKTAFTTINLIRSIPRRIFHNDPYLMSRYYQLPVNMIEAQLNGVTDKFLNTLIGRGDFVLTSSGYKCLEFNIAANIGGLHLPFWAVYYFENPIIVRFLKEHQVKIKDRDVIDVFLEHLVSTAQETLTNLDNHLNIAIVAQGSHKRTGPDKPNEPDEIETALNRIYTKKLDQFDKKLQGSIIFCDFDDLAVKGDSLYYNENQPVHILVESYEGAVPPEILHLFKIRRICLFNGPVTGLMSNKLNLALLSEHEESPCFNEEEREAIKTYIPWTRKILPSETLYHSEKIQLTDFIRQNREQLVMKPAVGYGGEGVLVGKYTSQDQWEIVLQTALQKGKWLVQEYMLSLPLFYQYGENGAEPHMGVVGFLVFGNRFGGGSIRMLPCSKRSGVINVHLGARVSILFEVE